MKVGGFLRKKKKGEHGWKGTVDNEKREMTCQRERKRGVGRETESVEESREIRVLRKRGKLEKNKIVILSGGELKARKKRKENSIKL